MSAPFTPEWAAPITGLPADQIREAARLIGTIHPTFIRMGNGIGDQTNDGTSTIRAICSDSRHHRQPRRTRRPVRPRRPAASSRPSPPLGELAPPDMVDRLVAPESPIWYQKSGRWDSGPTTAYYKGLMSVLTGKPYPLRVLNAELLQPPVGHPQSREGGRGPEEDRLHVRRWTSPTLRTSTSPTSCCPPARATSRATTSP